MGNSVELQGVSKSFGKTLAVDGLDLAVPDGSIYGFIGPNGSGKTTTLRLMLRIFQPDAGRVVVLGADQGNAADERLGYLPEERGLYKRMKVRALIEYFAHLKGFYHCRAEVGEWLTRLDAADWADKRIDSLSKGMAQKVQFIAAVIARPQLVILDEPFSGLDPVNMEVLKEALLSLRANGATVVFSTHDMSVAERLCDTVLMIFRGRKVLDGTLTEIQRRYPVNRLRFRLAGDAELPERLQGVATTARSGRFIEVTLDSANHAQNVLRQVAQVREVEHFELVRPTLHDIFVDIARPNLVSENGSAGAALGASDA
jgi:ABC-2 type transport system ATP-binding protein